jgi:peptidoglycan/LPS O-acetylase OafA/YrhL
MAQDQKDQSGFALPAPQTAGANAVSAATVSSSSVMQTEIVTSTTTSVNVDTSSRDLMIGGAILLVLFIVFFFARGAYANTLVAKRVPPNKANAAGWWLFVFLASLSVGVVLSAVNPARFLAPLIIGPLAVIAVVAVVLMILSGRK